MKIIILGAGLSGCMAYSFFKNNADILILDKKQNFNPIHDAILHFDNPEIGYLIGIKLKKIIIKKGICYKDEIYNISNIKFSNMYSMKVLGGGLSNRSIWNLENKERWISVSDFESKIPVKLGCKVEKINNNEIFFDGTSERFDFLISTIPIIYLLNLIDLDSDLSFKFNPIWVYKAELPVFSDVYQTIYFPDIFNPVYRSSVDGNYFIIESLSEIDDNIIKNVLLNFGFDFSIKFECNKQSFGKIIPVDDIKRKSLLFQITKKYNIYSLGRFAIWKNIKLSDVYNDLIKIKDMIFIPEEYKNYLYKKENI